MNPAILAAVITGAATVVAAAISFGAARRSRRISRDTQPADLEFVDITLGETTPRYWKQMTAPNLKWYEKEAHWYFESIDQFEGQDLPLEVTVLNKGADPIVISRVGVELIAGYNAWGSGKYYGFVPQAEEIELTNSYEIVMPQSSKRDACMGQDPDEEEWCQIGEIYQVILPKPVYLQSMAPFRFSLTVKRYDLGTPTHTILRVWMQSGTNEFRSDEVSVIFQR